MTAFAFNSVPFCTGKSKNDFHTSAMKLLPDADLLKASFCTRRMGDGVRKHCRKDARRGRG